MMRFWAAIIVIVLLVPFSYGQGSEWATKAPMPTPRTENVAASIGNKIYVVGGFAENGQTLNTVEVYDVETNTWSIAAPLAV